MSDSEAASQSGSASGSGSSSGSRSPSPPPAADAPVASTSKAPVTLTTEPTSSSVNFESLGVIEPLCAACASLGFTAPTDIQRECIPYGIAGKDIIGLAQTGSGKTAAFALPILQALWEEPSGLFACVLAPTRCVCRVSLGGWSTSSRFPSRELAYQIADQFLALGSGIGVRVATIVGGMDNMSQAVALAKKPHIIVATPGRLQDHLENTKGFSLRTLKYLVRFV